MTTPRTILVHVDASRRVEERVRFAGQLAEAFDAQALCQHAATPMVMRYVMAAESTAATMGLILEAEEAAHAAIEQRFERARAADPRLSWAGGRVDQSGFTASALYSDLILVGQSNPEDSAAAELPVDFVESLVIGTGKPALVLPYAGAWTPVPARVMVAWKPTREAARAVTAALPWLKRAKQVHVASFDEDGAQSAARLTRWLAGHGVRNVVSDLAPDASGQTGELLLSRAAEVGAELLVMGCFGHSRSREWILGGASRTLLKSMTLPVLMAH